MHKILTRKLNAGTKQKQLSFPVHCLFLDAGNTKKGEQMRKYTALMPILLILPEIMDTKIRTLIISVQGGAHHGQEEKSIHPGVQA